MVYDGGLELHLCKHGHAATLRFTLGSSVHFRLPDPDNDDPSTLAVSEGTVISLPVKEEQDHYTIQLEDGSTINLAPHDIWGPDDAIGGKEFYDPTQGDPTHHPRQPTWITPGTAVILEHDGQRLRGRLALANQGGWSFKQRTGCSKRDLILSVP